MGGDDGADLPATRPRRLDAVGERGEDAHRFEHERGDAPRRAPRMRSRQVRSSGVPPRPWTRTKSRVGLPAGADGTVDAASAGVKAETRGRGPGPPPDAAGRARARRGDRRGEATRARARVREPSRVTAAARGSDCGASDARGAADIVQTRRKGESAKRRRTAKAEPRARA